MKPPEFPDTRARIGDSARARAAYGLIGIAAILLFAPGLPLLVHALHAVLR